MVKYFIAAVFLFALSASPQPRKAAPKTSLTGTHWRIAEVNQHALPADGPKQTPNITFDPVAKRVTGFAGCNRFFGSYRQTGAQLKIENIGATRMACAGNLMDEENEILKALEQVDRFRIAGDEMELLADGRSVMRLKAEGAKE